MRSPLGGMERGSRLPALTCSRKRCTAASIRTRLRSCRSCASATFLQSARRRRHRSSSSSSAEPPSRAGRGTRMARLRHRQRQRQRHRDPPAPEAPAPRAARPARPRAPPAGRASQNLGGIPSPTGIDLTGLLPCEGREEEQEKLLDHSSPLPALGGLYLIRFVGFSSSPREVLMSP